MPTRSVRLPASNDTLVLVAGVAALVGLLIYVGVAFANARVPVDLAKEVAPWTPYRSTLTPVKHGKRSRFDVHVTPATKDTSYGALVQTLVPQPKLGTYTVSLWLRGSRPGVIGVEVNEFSPGVARYPVNTTVPATAKWHKYSYTVRIKTTWLGLAVFVSRPASPVRTRFTIRDLSVAAVGR